MAVFVKLCPVYRCTGIWAHEFGPPIIAAHSIGLCRHFIWMREVLRIKKRKMGMWVKEELGASLDMLNRWNYMMARTMIAVTMAAIISK